MAFETTELENLWYVQHAGEYTVGDPCGETLWPPVYTRIAIIFIQQKPETAGFKKPYLSNIIDQKFNKRVLNQQTSLKFALVIWS